MVEKGTVKSESYQGQTIYNVLRSTLQVLAVRKEGLIRVFRNKNIAPLTALATEQTRQ